MTKPDPRPVLGFGGGCHWCTEAVFAHVAGVTAVEQGFIASAPPDDTFSEAVRVAVDPRITSLRTLIEIHLDSHASGSNHTMRGKYRSAIYTTDPAQAEEAEGILEDLRLSGRPLVTRVLPLLAFRPSPPEYHRYWETRAGGPFCRSYIDPKLERLRARHAAVRDA